MRSGECDVVSLYVLCCSVNGSVCFVCFMCFVCFVFGRAWVCLLLNVMELLSVVGGALLDRACMVFQRCVCCVCGPSERLDAPSTCSVGVLYVESYLLI